MEHSEVANPELHTMKKEHPQQNSVSEREEIGSAGRCVRNASIRTANVRVRTGVAPRPVHATYIILRRTTF